MYPGAAEILTVSEVLTPVQIQECYSVDRVVDLCKGAHRRVCSRLLTSRDAVPAAISLGSFRGRLMAGDD